MEVPDYVRSFMEVFTKHKYQIYLVGGAVRDLLLGKTTKNWDFTTSATPDEILKLFPDGFYNNQFGTVGVAQNINSEQLIFEVTTFRKESDYKDSRHPEKIEWAKTVEEDLARRDFTINALAYDGEKIIDLYEGQKDLKAKLIRAVGDADKRFQEDALRLIRAIRLATQLEFLIEEKTRQSITKNSELIKNISFERIRDEFFKILASDHPAEGVLFLRSTGLLAQILPEVDNCFAVQQKSPKRHHIYDVGTHLVMSLKHCPSTDVITRFATLLHDIGKAETFRKDEKTELITFYNHEVAGTNQTIKIADRFKLSKKDKEKLVTLVQHHQFTVSEVQTDKAVRRFIKNVGVDNLDDMIALRIGDRIGSGASETSWRFDLFKKRLEEVQKEPFKVTDLKIDGNDVMKELKIKPGPEIGKILNTLFDEVAEKKLANEKKVLIEKLKTLKT